MNYKTGVTNNGIEYIVAGNKIIASYKPCSKIEYSKEFFNMSLKKLLNIKPIDVMKK